MKASALADGTVASLRKVKRKLEPKTNKAINRQLTRQKSEVVNRLYDQFGKSRQKALAAEDIYDEHKWTREMTEAMESTYLSVLDQNNNLIAPQLGSDFRLDDPATREYLKDAGINIPDISNTTRRQLRKALTAGQELGESVDELANRIKSLPAFGKSRAQRIARTELGHASNTSAIALYEESQIVESIQVYDGVMHPECAAVNGKILTLQEAKSFPTLGHPNCVRAFGAIPFGVTPSIPKPSVEPIIEPIDEDIAESRPLPKNKPSVDEISGKAYKKLPSNETDIERERQKSYGAIANTLHTSKDWQELAKTITGAKKYTEDIGKQATNKIDKAWWGTGSPESLALQKAVDKEFGLAAPVDHMKDQFSYNWQQAEDKFGKHDAAFREYARAQYDYTQKWIRDQGIGEKMYVSRGMSVDTLPEGMKAGKNYKGAAKNTDIEIDNQPLSSWAYDPRAALTFTGYGREHSIVMGQYVDTTKIFGIGAAGFSEGRWSEVVMLGGKSKVSAVAWKFDENTDIETVSLKPLTDKLSSD